MNRTRTLRLRSETVVDLGSDELTMVVGGTHATCDCPLTHGTTIDQECQFTISNPLANCVTGRVCELTARVLETQICS